MYRRRNAFAAVPATGLILVVAATAFAADTSVRSDAHAGPDRPHDAAEVELIDRRGERLQRAIREHRSEELTDRYEERYEAAEDLDAAPRRNLVGGPGEPSIDELREAIAALRGRIEKARDARREAASDGTAGAGGVAVAGVPQGTLEAIAACESGGDPGAVNSAGYYGKYQFDIGTWQSVGGSGNPAQASEAEQDKRAAMLYARAGASPWPVCGS